MIDNIYYNKKAIVSVKIHGQIESMYQWKEKTITKLNWKKFKFETVKKRFISGSSVFDNNYETLKELKDGSPLNKFVERTVNGEVKIFINPYLKINLVNGTTIIKYFTTYNKAEEYRDFLTEDWNTNCISEDCWNVKSNI